MNFQKVKKCNAWVKNTKTHCKKNSLLGSRYCWHHQSKIPILTTLLIAIISFIFPIFWDDYFPSDETKSLHNNVSLLPEIGDSVESIEKQMKELLIEKEDGLSEEFPAGYELFAIVLDNKEIIPYSKNITSDEISIDWSTAEVLEMNKKFTKMSLPDARIYKDINLIGNIVTIENKEGEIFSNFIKVGDWIPFVKVLKVYENGIIATTGYMRE